uniref:Uncharacterized protein n=1 Tax=Steinernema glaseri TaxID=37863 RepID=A0A1I7Y7X3_9BILA
MYLHNFSRYFIPGSCGSTNVNVVRSRIDRCPTPELIGQVLRASERSEKPRTVRRPLDGLSEPSFPSVSRLPSLSVLTRVSVSETDAVYSDA